LHGLASALKGRAGTPRRAPSLPIVRLLCLALTFSLGSCGSAGQQDLENVRSARSLIAEARLVAESGARLTGTYSVQMRAAAARQLAAIAASAAASGSPAGQAIAEVAALPAGAPAQMLAARERRARAIEQRLETR
jgi:murein L,D-transpeptidase YcbB/YkuD